MKIIDDADFELEYEIEIEKYSDLYEITIDASENNKARERNIRPHKLIADFEIIFSDLTTLKLKDEVLSALLKINTRYDKKTFKELNNYKEVDCCDNCIYFEGDYQVGFGICELDKLSDDSPDGEYYCETFICNKHKRRPKLF